MIRTMGNLLRAVFCIGVAGLIGYYNFGLNGWVGLATNIAFFALGFLLVSTWRNPENNRFDQTFETQSSHVTNTPVLVVEKKAEIAKEETAIVPSTETENG